VDTESVRSCGGLCERMVRPEGLEPSTPCLEGNASTHFQSVAVFRINEHSTTCGKVSRILGGELGGLEGRLAVFCRRPHQPSIRRHPGRDAGCPTLFRTDPSVQFSSTRLLKSSRVRRGDATGSSFLSACVNYDTPMRYPRCDDQE
jgi:hypothetical protein